LRSKDESSDALESFLVSARNLLGKNEKVCYIKSDQRTEYTGGKFLEVLERENIESEFFPPYTPEHNGIAGRFNKSLQRKIRALMFDSDLPKSMWELAVDTAVHMYNRSSHKTLNFKTPLRKFAPKVSNHFNKIKRFGSIAYVKLPKPAAKFDVKAIRS